MSHFKTKYRKIGAMNHASDYMFITNDIGFIILAQMTELRKLHVNNYTTLFRQLHDELS